MKPFKLFVLAACIVLMGSCRESSPTGGTFVLLPQPVEVNIGGNSSLSPGDIVACFSEDTIGIPECGGLLEDMQAVRKKSKAQIWYGLDQELGVRPEGYVLEITDKRISIYGKDRAGLLYGFMTLHQLMEDAAGQQVPLPICTIRDYPLLPYRAIHLDVKHHLEKREYYYRLIDRLAAYKINAIIAEMEDKLAYESQPVVGSSDALTIAEWKDLSEYAMDRNIEISPLIQGLGHASFILKHEQYADLRDDPLSDWAFNPLNPATYEVQFDLYRDALEATPYGRYLHVGGDEVHTTGRGSGKSSLELQLLWLEKVSAFAEENNRIPIFWDDMPLKYANLYGSIYDPELTQQEVDSIWNENEHVLLEFMDQFPRNCIYMRWNYSVPQALSNLKAMQWFRDHDLQVMGATAGQTRWVLMPQEESNMDNIRSFALSSIHQGLDGLLLTLWDDDSPHFELYMRGIISFAEYTWSGERRTKSEIKSAFRYREFSSKAAADSYAFIDRLEVPVAFWNNALLKERMDRRSLRKRSRPLEGGVIDLPDLERKGLWSDRYAERLEKAEQLVTVCDSVAAIIGSLKALADRNLYRLEVYEQVNHLARFAPSALIALKELDLAEGEVAEAAAMERLTELCNGFEGLRKNLEAVYSKTRILHKPEDYILDQDHHNHLANQTRSFDWLFTSELFFIEKVKEVYTLGKSGSSRTGEM
jgi:hypothetical protein